MGYTMAEKILMKNTGLSHLAPGDLIMTRPDMCMVHDIYTPFVVQKLDEMKFRRLADPEKAVIFLDHLCPTNQATGDPRHYHKGHELSDRFGIRKLHAGEGSSHPDARIPLCPARYGGGSYRQPHSHLWRAGASAPG